MEAASHAFCVDTADSPTRSLGFWDETSGYAKIKPLIHKLYKRIGVYNSQISGKILSESVAWILNRKKQF